MGASRCREDARGQGITNHDTDYVDTELFGPRVLRVKHQFSSCKLWQMRVQLKLARDRCRSQFKRLNGFSCKILTLTKQG